MKENKFLAINLEGKREEASNEDIEFFNDLAKEIEQNGYKEKYDLELKRDNNNFIIKIGQETIYIPQWHEITIKKDHTKSEMKIEKYVLKVLKDHGIDIENYEK